jgi:transcriptional regulator with XRE-family HTH domain
MPDERGLGDRLRSVRKRRGLTQRELAQTARVSLSLVKKLEQGAREDIRLETARQLAVALDIPTSALTDAPDVPVPASDSTARWEPVRRAISGEHVGEPPEEEPTLEGLRAAFSAVTPLILDGRFDQAREVVPALLRDADALAAIIPRQRREGALTLRSQIRQIAGSLMLHVWEFDAAAQAFDAALQDAQDPLTAASVTEERCWGLIRQGRLTETRDLAFSWAEDTEPRISKASREELAAWARLLIRASAAAIRDNRQDEADAALRLARMAALGARSDFLLPYSPWHVFGPHAVAVMMAEHALIAGRPEAVLEIGGRLDGARTIRYTPSHRLDVAQAHAMLRHDAEAVGVLQELRAQRPQWLAHQRHAADILAIMIRRRRKLTAEMRELADAVRLPM